MSLGRVLVVDDEPQIRRVLRSSLAARGYEVHDAPTGEEALKSLRQSRFDLVLLDVNMPGMGGLEACREIRAGSAVAIIMLTVSDSEEGKVAALDAGADDYVTKPFGYAGTTRTDSSRSAPVAGISRSATNIGGGRGIADQFHAAASDRERP